MGEQVSTASKSSRLATTGNPATDIAISFIQEGFGAIKDMYATKQMNETERVRIREQAKVVIAQIEANTKKVVKAMELDHEFRMSMLGWFRDLTVGKETIDPQVIAMISNNILPMLQASPSLSQINDTSNRNHLIE